MSLLGRIKQTRMPVTKLPPVPQQKHPVPPELLATVLAHLIQEHGKASNELQTALASLVSERHRHFHTSNGDPENSWTTCSNAVCVQMARLLEKSRTETSEVRITPLAMSAASGRRIMFDVHQNYLRVFTEQKSAIEKPRIIIP